MKRIIAITIGTGVMFALLALSGCSQEDAQRSADALGETASEARDVAADAASQAGKAASNAAESARETTEDAADAASDAASNIQQKAEKGAGSMMDAAAGALGGGPADACKKLAAQQNWDKALDVCREALKLFPNDMELEHAVQQAEAAAAE